MNDPLLLETLIVPLGWTLVHSLWQGSLIGLATALALAACRRRSAGSRYWIACAGLMSMVLAFLITFSRQLPTRAEALRSNQPSLVQRTSPTTPTGVPSIFPFPTLPNSSPTFRNAGDFARPPQFLGWLVLTWALGVTGLSLRSLGAWRRLRSLRVGASPVIKLPLLRRLRELAERIGLRREVRLLTSAALEVPATLGWLKPFIVLPAATMAGLTPAQLECILLHELAHIRRHDYLVNLAQIAIENLLFYHPAVWWVSGRIREEREFCCDDLVLQHQGDGLEYARALAKLEEARSLQPSLALAANDGPLLRRIRRITGVGEVQASPVVVWPMMLALLIGAGLWPAVSNALSESSKSQPSQASPTNSTHLPNSRSNEVITVESTIEGIRGAIAQRRDRLNFIRRQTLNAYLDRAQTNGAAASEPSMRMTREDQLEMDRVSAEMVRLEADLEMVCQLAGVPVLQGPEVSKSTNQPGQGDGGFPNSLAHRLQTARNNQRLVEAQIEVQKDLAAAIESQTDGTEEGFTQLAAKIEKLARQERSIRQQLNQNRTLKNDESTVEELERAYRAERIRYLEGQLNQIPPQIVELEGKLARTKYKPIDELRAMLPTLAPDPVLRLLLATESKAREKAAALSLELGPNHPSVEAKNALAEKFHDQVYWRCKGIVRGFETDIEQLHETYSRWRRQLEIVINNESPFPTAKKSKP